MCTNNSGHMTKIVANPIYGKNPSIYGKNRSKIFSATAEFIAIKLDNVAIGNRVLLYNAFINHGPVMTLTNFNARSTHVIYVDSCLNVIEGKNFKKWANGQNIYDFEKRKKK